MIVRGKSMAIGAMAACCLAFFAGPAPAAITYTFTQSNFIGDGGNYGTVEVKAGVADGLATGTVQFTLNINPLRVDDEFGSFAFNTDLNLTAGQISASIASWNPADGGTNNDGFGTMDWRVRDTSNDGRSPTVTVTVSGLGAGEDTIAHFYSLGGGGSEGQPHYTAELFPADGNTGFVGDNSTLPPPIDTPSAPEPTSLAIWVLGMVAAGFGARRMRKQK